jgi:uncharacterized FlaG/YvyC family protein
MGIGNGGTPPLTVVHGVVETHTRDGTGGSSHPARQHPDQKETGAAAASEPTAPKSVQLPEFPNYELSFRLDEEGGRVVVQVIDAKTGEVVRTLPPQDLGAKLKRLPDGRGVLLDRKG